MKNAHSRILSPALALLPSSFCVAFIPRPRLATALFSKCRNESLEKSRLNVITYLFTLTAHIPHVIFCHLVFLFFFFVPFFFSSLFISSLLFFTTLHFTRLQYTTPLHSLLLFFSLFSPPIPLFCSLCRCVRMCVVSRNRRTGYKTTKSSHLYRACQNCVTNGEKKESSYNFRQRLPFYFYL